MLELRALTRRYGGRLALDGVSFSVPRGRIVGLLGANGAGKSTLLRTAAGLQPPDSGAVLVDGHDVWAAPLAAKHALGYAAEEPSFHEELSAHEYLAFVAAVRGLEPGAASERALRLAHALELAPRLDEPVRGFSHGMRKKLSFLAAVLHEPRELLCDEALEGFDAPAALYARETLRTLAAGGAAVLFSSHVTEAVERLCDRVIVLHRGRVVRAIARDEWGVTAPGLTTLERAFLDLIRTPAAEVPA